MQTTLRVLAIIYAGYLGLALLVVTPLLNFLPAGYVEEHYGRTLKTEWVILNPFKLSLDLSRLELSETDRSPFLALGDTSINLSLASLWREGIVFDEIRLTDIVGNFIHLGDGELNFSDLMASEETETEEPAEEDPLGVTIEALHVHARELHFHDQSREVPYESEWNDLSLDAEKLSTVQVEGQPYTLDLQGPKGGQLHWRGQLSLAAGTSTGSLSLNELSLVNLGHAAAPWLNFAIADGRLTVEGNYDIDWSGDLRYSIRQGGVSVSSLELTPSDSADLADTGATLESLKVSGIAVDSETQHVEIGAVDISGLGATGWMEDERISLQEMFTGPASEEPGTEPEGEAASDESGWSAAVGRVQVSDSAVHFRSPFTDPGEMHIQPIAAEVENLSWPFDGDSPFSLSLAVNDSANFNGSGSLALAQGAGDINYKLTGLALSWLDPNLPEQLHADISSGTLEVDGSVTLKDFQPTRVLLDGAVRDFSISNPATADEGAEMAVTSWETVRLEGVSADLEAQAVAIARIAIVKYIGRVHILEDGSINASKLWQEQQAEAEPADAPAEENAEEATNAEAPWSVDIPKIELADSEIDFMDQSLPIPFRTIIGEINGNILGLSSELGEAAEVDIKGSVDGYSPVSLSGDMAPLADPMGLDLALVFTSLDMESLSPYSSTYAGYKIERGMLDIDLAYSLEDNLLKGENHIVMKQLKLGEKIESDKAIDLPLDFALTLLTDSQGVINMDIPVAGNIDDPSFQLGNIIVTAFIGLIREVITAPFKLLGSIVGSDEDFQHINFPAGSAVLDDAGRKKITDLSTALLERPKIELVLTGTINKEGDILRLQKDRVNADMLEAGVSQEEIDAKAPDWEKEIARHYKKMSGQSGEDAGITVRDQYIALAEAVQINEAQLIELANQRAAAARAAFIEDGGLPEERTTLREPELDNDKHQFGGVLLDIE